MITAIFASSDGWMPNGPNPSQRDEPFTVLPPINTAINKTSPTP